MPTLREWGGTSLDTISYSGSFAKGTAISLGTDIDLFLSVNHACDKSVRDIYLDLYPFSKDGNSIRKLGMSRCG